MKNEVSISICPICSAQIEETEKGQYAVCQFCQICDYTSDIDILTALREEAIINGLFDEQ